MNDHTKRDSDRADALTKRDSSSASSGIQTGRVGEAKAGNPTFEQREREAGLFLAGNDPMAGRREPAPIPPTVINQRTGNLDSDFDDFLLPSREAGGGGFSVRQIAGGIASSGDAEPSTAAYQEALVAAYDAAGVEPSFGDLVTLRVSGGSRLIARFWILNDDQAATNATVSFNYDIGDPPVSTAFYALNFAYAPLEQIIQAIQDYIGGPDGGQEPDGRDIEPESVGPFAISVNGMYDTSPEGFLIPGIGNPTIRVRGGKITPIKGLEENITSDFTTTDFGFLANDGWYAVNLFVQTDITHTGTQGNRQVDSVSAQIAAFNSTDADTNIGGRFISTTVYRHFTNIGTVALAKSGNRRFARITQTRVGDISGISFGSNAGGDGSTDANGVVLKDGLREVLLCIKGKPYSAFGLFFNLTEVT
jgi:hypothetical protein